MMRVRLELAMKPRHQKSSFNKTVLKCIYDHMYFDFGHHRYPRQYNGMNIFEDNKINQVCRMFHIDSSLEQADLYASSTGCRRRNT